MTDDRKGNRKMRRFVKGMIPLGLAAMLMWSMSTAVFAADGDPAPDGDGQTTEQPAEEPAEAPAEDPGAGDIETPGAGGGL